MTTQTELNKQAAAWAALKYIEEETIVGVGTGSTAGYFIDALASIKGKIKGAVSSSEASTAKLKAAGIPVFDCNEVTSLAVYIDGADEINGALEMIKGGGGALTREKVIAAIAQTFVCIVDEAKQVDILGTFPLPIEVVPMARSYVARELIKLGGRPVYRQDFVTDNGNIILDVHNLQIIHAMDLENRLNNIPGIVTVGLFAKRSADVVLVGGSDGVKEIKAGSY